ncbi:MAG: ribonuclease P protein component [Marinilabiliales bacterium]|nr:MAG: ribonuclease P protein component [Marinilabiliales bacterium]
MEERYTFKKSERLNSKILINQLFSDGKSFFEFPFKVVFKSVDNIDNKSNSILISVPKRNFKNATDRNKIKRLIRESYRLNKHILIDDATPEKRNWNIAFIYNAKSILTFKEIERKIILILQSIKKQDEISTF